jgi:CelD/BcsL family acetyltransferase involved in cellulose biosynthesis
MGFVRGDRFFGYQKASCDDFRAFSPDSILMDRMIEECIRDGLGRFEMGQGGEEYKEKWASARRPLWTLCSSNATFRGRLHRFTNGLRGRWHGNHEKIS